MVYVLQDAEVSVAVVEDQEQVDKMLEVREQCPALQRVVYDDPRGLRHYADPMLMSYEQLEALGQNTPRSTRLLRPRRRGSQAA